MTVANDPRYCELLERYHTSQTRHSNRTFLGHLANTAKLLESWGADAHVCAAGLFHSIYGTDVFHIRSAPLGDRELVRTTIGSRAERLVYLFCAMDRPSLYANAMRADRFSIVDRHAHAEVAIDRETAVDLLTIEAANLLEQRGKGPLVQRVLLAILPDAVLRGPMIRGLRQVARHGEPLLGPHALAAYRTIATPRLFG